MTPSEHREKAIELLERAADPFGGTARQAVDLAEAQVHATLSLGEAPTPTVVTITGAISLVDLDGIRAALAEGGPALLALEHGVEITSPTPGTLHIHIPAPEDEEPLESPVTLSEAVRRAERAVNEVVDSRPTPTRRTKRDT